MNARDSLQEISQYLTGQEHWLVGRLSDVPRVLTSIADRVIAMAEDLKRFKTERIEKLAREGPSVHKSVCGEITVTLLRDEKERFHQAGEYYIEVTRTNKSEVREHFKLTDPPHDDGYTYMLQFKPLGFGPQGYAIQVSFSEAQSIQKQLDAIYKST